MRTCPNLTRGRTRWLLGLPVAALALTSVAPTTASAVAGSPVPRLLQASVASAVPAAGQTVTTAAAPKYASPAMVLRTLMTTQAATKMVWGSKATAQGAKTVSHTERLVIPNYLTEQYTSHGFVYHLATPRPLPQPRLVGVWDDGTGYAASQDLQGTVYRNAGRTCQSKTTFKVSSTSPVRGVIWSCTLKLGKVKYATRYAQLRANSALVFAECWARYPRTTAATLNACAIKLAIAQHAKTKALFASAPYQLAMPPAKAFTWDMVTVTCAALPCVADGTLTTYAYNQFPVTPAGLKVTRLTGATLRFTLSAVPAATKKFTVVVSAPYNYAPPTRLTVTVIPTTLVAGATASSWQSQVYGEADSPGTPCSASKAGHTGTLFWCHATLVPVNTGTGSFTAVQAYAHSNPNNAASTGLGLIAYATDGSGKPVIWFWPNHNGPYTETVHYRLKNTALGIFSGWTDMSVTFDYDPNFA